MHDGGWVQALGQYFEKVVGMMGMQDCRPSKSHKRDKVTEQGDEEPCEKLELNRRMFFYLFLFGARDHRCNTLFDGRSCDRRILIARLGGKLSRQ